MTNDESQSISRRTFMTTSLAAGALVSTGVNPLLELHAGSPARSPAPAAALHNAGGPVEEKSIAQLQ